jgi:hypothetical protein
MAMARPLTKAGRRPNDEPLPDQGCAYAPACQTCLWRARYFLLPTPERKIFSRAFRTLETFKAPPDEGIT